MTPAASVHCGRRQLLVRSAAALGCVAVSPLGLLTAAWAQTAPANPVAPPEVAAALANSRLQGRGQLRFLGLRVYEARLWAVAGQPVNPQAWAQQPLALEILYQRALQGGQIAERSLQEMQRQGALDDATAQRWLQAMKALFPDVSAGSRITGLNLPRTGLRFYVDGVPKGGVDETDFARRFLGIWLAPQSSEPTLRAALLGAATAPSPS